MAPNQCLAVAVIVENRAASLSSKSALPPMPTNKPLFGVLVLVLNGFYTSLSFKHCEQLHQKPHVESSFRRLSTTFISFSSPPR